MYYTDISNNELQYFHNLKVNNFTIGLTDMLSSDLFKVETVKADSIYKIYPLFYVNEITCSNANDNVLDNKVIICQKLTSETYFSFISNPEEPIYDYVEYGSYFDVGDDLTENEFNGIVSMLRRFVKHTDDIKLKQGKVKGKYGDYVFNINGTTVTDKGILITEETITNLGTVKLKENVFSNSRYTLHLKVYHMTDINVSGEVSEDNIVWEELIVELEPNKAITIPFSQLDFDYVIGFDGKVVIDHNVPVIVDYETLFEDRAILGDSNIDYWYYSASYTSHSVDEEGTTVTAIRAGSFATVSATMTQNPTGSDIYIYSTPFTVEFDLLGWEDNQGATSDYAGIRIYHQGQNKIAYWNVKDYGIGHYKIVCTENSQKLFFEGEEQTRNFTFPPTTAWNVAFQTKGKIKFKNFKITKPLITNIIFSDDCSNDTKLTNYTSSINLTDGNSSSVSLTYDNNNQCYSLSGSGNYISALQIPKLNKRDNVKLRLKFKLTQSSNYNQLIIAIANNNTDNTGFDGVRLMEGSFQHFYDTGNRGGTSTTKSSISNVTTQWHYLELVKNENSITGKIYDSSMNILSSFTESLHNTYTNDIYYLFGTNTEWSYNVLISEIIAERVEE